MALNFESVDQHLAVAGLSPNQNMGMVEGLKIDAAIAQDLGGQMIFVTPGDPGSCSIDPVQTAAVARVVTITLSGDNTSAISLTFTGSTDTTSVTIAAGDTAAEVAAKVVAAVNADSGALYTASNVGPILSFTADTAGAAANANTVSIAVTDDTLTAGTATNYVVGADAVNKKFCGFVQYRPLQNSCIAGENIPVRTHGFMWVTVLDAVSAWNPAYYNGSSVQSTAGTAINANARFRTNASAGGLALLEF